MNPKNPNDGLPPGQPPIPETQAHDAGGPTQPFDRLHRVSRSLADAQATKPLGSPLASPPPKQARVAIAAVVVVALVVATIWGIGRLSGGNGGNGPTGGATTLGITVPTVKTPPPAALTNWPGFLYNQQGWNYNPQETILSPADVSQLRLVSTYNTGQDALVKDGIASTPLIIGNRLDYGSWDGYYYSIDLLHHTVIWKVFMGIVVPKPNKGCNPPLAGVTSKATVVNGVLYVGGADGKVYAVNADTGKVNWATQVTAVVPAHDGYPATDLQDEFLWSSPAIGNGKVYIGIGSYGDCPLIPGHLMALDQTSGQILATHWTEKVNAGGVTIWNRPVIDPADQAVLYATGSLSSGPESDAIVELDWNTLQYKQDVTHSVYQVPRPDQGENDAFGASCMLVPNIGGSQGIVCHSKATRLYGVQITPTGLVPDWRIELGQTDGQAPEYDQADVGEYAFDGKDLYVGTTRIKDANGTVYPGGAYCIDPSTGKVIWTQYFTHAMGYPLTAPTGANGIIAFGLGQPQYNATYPNDNYIGSLAVLDARTGAILYTHPLSFLVYAAPIIVNGEIYVATMDGHIYTFGLPQVPTVDLFNASTLDPHQWQWLHPDTKHWRLINQTLQIDASGESALDARNLLAEPLSASNDVDLTTTLTFSPRTVYGQAGIVAYQDSNNYVKLDYIKLQNANEYRFELTAVVNGQVQSNLSADIYPPGTAYTLELVRLQGHYFGYVSADGGQHWQTVVPSPLGVTANIQTVSAGLFAYSSGSSVDTAAFTDFIEMPLS